MKGRGLKIAAIIVGVLVVAVVILSFVLDSILTSKAHDEAGKLSQQWGRPVTIGSISTKLLTGLGVRVSDVQIGAAQGEPLPFVDLKRVEVRAALLKALFSAGKTVEIRSAEIDGLTVNVIRLPDGTTNLERFQQKLASESEKPKPSPENEKPTDLSFLRVDHAALTEGQVQLVDMTKGGQKQLGVKHLDIRVDDLRAGKPLDVALKAAVLTDKQNLDIHLKAAPLPPTLTPTPQQISLHVDPPIDLAPLGPFTGKEVGLQGGTFDADFDMNLGAAVAGGEGATSIKGAVKMAALRFAGAQGGKSLDVTLDTDVKGDAKAGDVQIDKLRLDIGPAGLTGHGVAKALTSPNPQIQGLEIVSHDLDPEKLAAYYPPLRKQLNGMISGPIGLSLRASGTQAQQALELKVDLTPVKLSVPDTLAKAAGAPMTLTAHARGAAAQNGPIRYDAQMNLEGVDLRPGQSIDKKPGQRLDLAVSGSRSANQSSTDPRQHIAVDDLKVHILEDALQGKGTVDMSGAGAKKQTKFELSLASDRLDLDKMLIAGEKPKKKDEKPLDPKTFAGLNGHATVKIDRLIQKKQELTDIVADVTMVEDQITVTKAQLKAFGGTADASGTQMRLAHPDDPFHVVLKIANVELANTISLASEKKILGGKFTGNVDLKGGGQKVADLAKTLAGVIDGSIANGSFFGKDLIATVTGPLSKALPASLAGKVTDGGRTDLGKNLPFGVTLQNGVATLKQPINVSTPAANLSFGGGVRVDGNLDMPGTISLTPQTIGSITGGKVTPAQPIPVTLRLTGPAWSPTPEGLDLKPAVTAIVQQAGTALLGRALGVDNVQAKQQQVTQQAQAKADQEAKKAQQQAAAAAEAQKKKIQDQAANKLKGLFGR